MNVVINYNGEYTLGGTKTEDSGTVAAREGGISCSHTACTGATLEC